MTAVKNFGRLIFRPDVSWVSDWVCSAVVAPLGLQLSPIHIRGARPSGGNIVLKSIYRSIEYAVRELDDGHWQWATYPRMEEGANSAGVETTREKAIAACKAEIDTRFAAKKSK